MTAAEMQALAPAPEGCEWESGPPFKAEAWWAILQTTAGQAIKIRISSHFGGTLNAPGVLLTDRTHPTPIDALIALRRLAGHLWPWPGWPVVEGVRPAGWWPWVLRDIEAHDGHWLVRAVAPVPVGYEGIGCEPSRWALRRRNHAEMEYCAIDRDGRWVEVDTRGQG